jgi:hypothetical protein
MVRRAVVPAVLMAVAGCGGSPDVPDERPAPHPRGVFGELRSPDARSPDARSPFMTAGAGAWRCPTAGRLELAMTADGDATLSIGGRLLAFVAPSRALVSRACERESGARARAPAVARGGRLGATVVRCRAPGVVVVDFRAGDVTVVRADGRGRFLARASVSPDRIGVAAYWGAGCTPA